MFQILFNKLLLKDLLLSKSLASFYLTNNYLKSKSELYVKLCFRRQMTIWMVRYTLMSFHKNSYFFRRYRIKLSSTVVSLGFLQSKTNLKRKLVRKVINARRNNCLELQLTKKMMSYLELHLSCLFLLYIFFKILIVYTLSYLR